MSDGNSYEFGSSRRGVKRITGMRVITHLSVVGKSLAVGSFLEGTIRVPPFLAPLTFFSMNLGAGLAA